MMHSTKGRVAFKRFKNAPLLHCGQIMFVCLRILLFASKENAKSLVKARLFRQWAFEQSTQAAAMQSLAVGLHSSTELTLLQ